MRRLKNLFNKKKNKQIAAMLAVALSSTSLIYPAVSYAENSYDKYNQVVEVGYHGYDIYQKIQAAKKAEEAAEAARAAEAAKNTSNAANAVADTAEAVGEGTEVAKKGKDFMGQAGAAISAAGSLADLAMGGAQDPGNMASSLGDLANSAQDFGWEAGGELADGLGVVGSVFGQKISDSMTYRSVGSHGRYVCTSSTPYSTINENVRVHCVGVPTHGAQFVVPPILDFSDTPTHGGKKNFVGGGVPWRCGHHGCWPVGSIAVTVEYNTYEGDVTMGGDMYFNPSDYNSMFGHDGDSGGIFGADGKGFEYDPYAGMVVPGTGSLFDATSNYFANGGAGNNPYANGSNPYSGYYDQNGVWHNGGNGSNPYGDINYDAGLNGQGNAYDWNSSNYNSDLNNGFHDGSGSYNAGGADWASSTGGGGYYDENGIWHNGSNPFDGGHFDSNGNWHEGDGSPYGSDNLDDYFNSGATADGINGFDAASGMTSDITGLDAVNSTMSALEALANGGHVGEDGIIYDAEGNAWGSAQAAGLIALEEGSDQLNNILAQGGWIDENGNVFDANGRIVGYVVPAGSSNVESEAFEDASMFEKSRAMMEEFLKSLGNDNGGDAGLMERLTGSQEGSFLASLKSTFGMSSAEDVRRETMTPQQMYDVVAKLLKELGYSDADIAMGVNYDKNSAYTEPEKAWDMNRITTLQKNFKIDTHIQTPKTSSTMMNAANNFGAVKATTQPTRN